MFKNLYPIFAQEKQQQREMLACMQGGNCSTVIGAQ